MGFSFVGGGTFCGVFFWGWGEGRLPARGLDARPAANGGGRGAERIEGTRRRRGGAPARVGEPLVAPASLAGVEAVARVLDDAVARLRARVLVRPALVAGELADDPLAGLGALDDGVALAQALAGADGDVARVDLALNRLLVEERGGLDLGVVLEARGALDLGLDGAGLGLVAEGHVAPGNAVADESLEDGGVAHHQRVARAVAAAVPRVVRRRVEVRGVVVVELKGVVLKDRRGQRRDLGRHWSGKGGGGELS